MSSLDRIPVHVVAMDSGLTGQAEAVLTEVAEMLRRLLDDGVEDSIDLLGLPLSPADKDWLDGQLGRGEVEIGMDAGGKSILAETAFPGVWKILHRDTQDRVVAELIEVAFVPAIIRPDKMDVEKGYKGLLLNLKPKGA